MKWMRRLGMALLVWSYRNDPYTVEDELVTGTECKDCKIVTWWMDQIPPTACKKCGNPFLWD